jgi:CBS domain-containing protein
MDRRIVPDVVSGQNLATLNPDATVKQAAALMVDHHCAAVLVMNGDKLAGIFTERDITRRVVAEGRDPDTTKLADVMTPDPDTLSGDDLAGSALERMTERGYRHLPVVDDGKVVGMVSIRDLYRTAKEMLEADLRDREAFIFGDGYGH